MIFPFFFLLCLTYFIDYIFHSSICLIWLSLFFYLVCPWLSLLLIYFPIVHWFFSWHFLFFSLFSFHFDKPLLRYIIVSPIYLSRPVVCSSILRNLFSIVYVFLVLETFSSTQQSRLAVVVLIPIDFIFIPSLMTQTPSSNLIYYSFTSSIIPLFLLLCQTFVATGRIPLYFLTFKNLNPGLALCQNVNLHDVDVQDLGASARRSNRVVDWP